MTYVSDPVHVATGVHVHPDPSFMLRGIIPFVIGSVYYSDVASEGPFGRGRLSAMDQTLRMTDGRTIELLDDCNYPTRFERPRVATEAWIDCDTNRHLRLSMRQDGSYLVKDGRLFRRFRKHDDRLWLLESIEDENNNFVRFERRTDGYIYMLRNSGQLKVLFENCDGLRITARLRGSDGSEVEIMRWNYDSRRRLIEVEAVHGLAARYGYDERHRQTTAQTSDGFSSRHVYDARDRVIGIRSNGPFDGDRFEYDDVRRETRYFPGGDGGRAITYLRSDEDMVVAESDSLGISARKEYGSRGELTSLTDGEGNCTRYSYHPDGNLARIVDPEGRRISLDWNDLGQISSVTDGVGATTTYEHDEKGRLVSSIDAMGHRTDYTNDESGLIIGIMRHDGLIERREYDSRKNLVQIVDFSGRRTDFSYDAFGRLISTKGASGQASRFEYRTQPGYDFWEPSRVIRPDGVATCVEFDRRSSERVETDGENRRFTYKFGPRGLIASMQDPLGHVIRFQYDHSGRLSGVENQNGAVWHFERDARGRVIREVNTESVATTYSHDLADRVISVGFADGARMGLSYDRTGLLVRQTVREADASPAQTTNFSYDARGLLVQAANRSATVALDRDRSGRIVGETTNGRKIESVFDCCGNRVERRIDQKSLTATYDPMGGLRSLTIEGREPLTFVRDASGQEIQRRSRAGFVLDQSFDAVGQIISQIAGRGLSSDGSPGRIFDTQVRRDFSWSGSFEPTAIDDFRWGTTRCTFDGRGQLLSATFSDGGGERYTYGAAMTVSASAGVTQAPTPWLSTAGGRVKAARGPEGERVTVTHDQRGRAAERRVERHGFRPKTWRFAWDAQDQLVACTTPSGDVWHYEYDPFGRRISKSRVALGNAVDPSGEAAPTSPSRTHFFWDGDLMVEEAPSRLDGSPDVEAATRWHYEPGTFRPLARVSPRGEMLYIVNDHLGTPREMLDEHGAVRWAATLFTWGAVRKAHLSPEGDAVDCPIRFQGQWFDAETGLSYNRYRYYDPLTTEYVSFDPIGIRGGIGAAAYVNCTANKIDPFGLIIHYGPLDGLGRPTGNSADLGIGDLRPTASSEPTFDPPGWQGGGPPYFQNRGHLIADSFGGSGSDGRNLVTITNGTNNPGMKRIEDKVRKYIRQNPNCRVNYTVKPNYNGNNPIPTSITMHAVSSDGTVIASDVIPNGLFQKMQVP